MHSPPPTPYTRSSKHAKRTINLLAYDAPTTDSLARGRKRTFSQAGLITPRQTPADRKQNHESRVDVGKAAKVLFPGPNGGKFCVYQDPKSPDPFFDDKTNPFREQTPAKKCQTRPPDSPELVDTHIDSLPNSSTQFEGSLSDTRTARARRRTDRSATDARRPDGMTYVFRGRKVFRKYKTSEEAQIAESLQPKLLFQKELSAPKLSNPFEEQDDTSSGDHAEDDDLHESSLATKRSRTLRKSVTRHAVPLQQTLR